MSSHLLYIEDLQELFTDVQIQRIFADQKLFPDSQPKFAVSEIVEQYHVQKQAPDFDLLSFVHANFILPSKTEFEPEVSVASPEVHIRLLWDILTKETENEYSSLIYMPHKFVVPGGRFREFFYWDSYFTMLGLQVSGRIDLIENMVDNFAYLIDTFGFIPNGNRSYFLSRSQPPFFSLMVALLAEEQGDTCYVKYLPQLKAEYFFWMHGIETLTEEEKAQEHVVLMPDGEVLNRFWDRMNTPRPEGYYEDLEIHEAATAENKKELYRNIRAACASGWDFSGRWFEDEKDISTVKTIDLVPVDLNSLMWHLEFILAKGSALSGNDTDFNKYTEKADQRSAAIKKYLWDEKKEGYFDYNFRLSSTCDCFSMAMAFPLFFNISSAEEAKKVTSHLENIFLKDGGLLNTPNITGQQWDAPNGWAPLQWIGYKAAKNYNETALAGTIANRWIATVERVFKNTGQMMEKYNVLDVTLGAGGGEYPNQNGFGWTNGVYLKMKKDQ